MVHKFSIIVSRVMVIRGRNRTRLIKGLLPPKVSSLIFLTSNFWGHLTSRVSVERAVEGAIEIRLRCAQAGPGHSAFSKKKFGCWM